MWNPDGYDAYMGRSNYPTPHVEDEVIKIVALYRYACHLFKYM